MAHDVTDMSSRCGRDAASKLLGADLRATVRRWARCAVMLSLSTASFAQEVLIPPQVPVPATYFGMHFHRATESTTVPRRGIGSWRLWDARVAWRYLDPFGRGLNFAPLDQLVSLARQRKIDLVYTFGATPEWASARPTEKGPYGVGSAAEPARLDDWQDYVTRIGRRYKGEIKNYELWNEPNGGFFTGSVPALVEMSCAAASTLRQIDPAVVIISPSGIGHYPQPLQWLRDYLDAGGGACVDVIAWHFYAPQGTPESVLGTIGVIRTIMREHGAGDKPLWSTEAGWRLALGNSKAPAIDPKWPKLDAEKSEAYIARALLVGWAAGLSRYYYYAWDHHDMGFVTESGQVTASASAFLTMREWMLGAVVHSCKPHGANWICRLQRGTTGSVIAWRETGDAAPWQPEPGFTSVTALDGSTSTLAARQAIMLGTRPVRLSP